MWHYVEAGRGRPLILLHGLGMSHRVWAPVMTRLAACRRVIAFDIAGFGETAPLPPHVVPSVPNLVSALEQSMLALGIRHGNADVAGNSLGGWMALEAARRGSVRSAVAISPAGLWNAHPPAFAAGVFRTLRIVTGRWPSLVKAAMRIPLLRELSLAIPISVGSRRMPAEDAIRTVDDLATARAFERTFESTRGAFDGRAIAIPVTVAFGSRDYILPRGARERHRLPPHARWIERPRWGHVPMWLDPDGVSQLILNGTG